MRARPSEDQVVAPVLAAARAYLYAGGDLRAIEREAARAHSRVDDPPSVVDALLGIAAEASMGAIHERQARQEIQAAVDGAERVTFHHRIVAYIGTLQLVRPRHSRTASDTGMVVMQ